METLKRGSKSKAVKQLQEQLNKLGFDADIPDGDFGEKTELAVKQFQKSKGLKDDGVAGPKTLAALFRVKSMQVKAPSGIIFDIFDSLNIDNEHLKAFHPDQPINQGYNLPILYIAVNSKADLEKNLTDHFKLREFISDKEAGENRDKLTYPYFVPVAIVRLAQALEELRVRLDNQSLKLSSGYRSPFYYQDTPDTASAHRFGTAVDIASVGDVEAGSELLKIVYNKAFDGHPEAGTRLDTPSSLGFVYAESAEEIIRGSRNGTIDHAHLDMGYISGYSEEINHLGDLAFDTKTLP